MIRSIAFDAVEYAPQHNQGTEASSNRSEDRNLLFIHLDAQCIEFQIDWSLTFWIIYNLNIQVVDNFNHCIYLSNHDDMRVAAMVFSPMSLLLPKASSAKEKMTVGSQ